MISVSRQAAEAQTKPEVIDSGAAGLTLEMKLVAWRFDIPARDGLVHRLLARAIIRACEDLRFVFRVKKLGATSEYGIGTLLPLPRRG